MLGLWWRSRNSFLNINDTTGLWLLFAQKNWVPIASATFYPYYFHSNWCFCTRSAWVSCQECEKKRRIVRLSRRSYLDKGRWNNTSTTTQSRHCIQSWSYQQTGKILQATRVSQCEHAMVTDGELIFFSLPLSLSTQLAVLSSLTDVMQKTSRVKAARWRGGTWLCILAVKQVNHWAQRNAFAKEPIFLLNWCDLFDKSIGETLALFILVSCNKLSVIS